MTYWDILDELLREDKVQQLKQYRQHRFTNTYEHCRHVAVVSYALSQKCHLKVSETSLAVGAVFHDFYLYDIEEEQLTPWQHGTRHAAIAVRNVEKLRSLNALEREIILCHMWPLNITRIPRRREAWLVCVADKICAVEEMFFYKYMYRKTSFAADQLKIR